jgi:hypothetical protein
MAKYEVFLPAAREGEFNLTLRVDADNWMAALKAGLKKLGEHGSQVSNLLVDIMEDNSIHVTDSTSGRVFRIKELEEAAPKPIPLATPAPIPLATPAPIPLATPAPIALSTPAAELPGSDAPTPKELPAVEPPPPPAPKQASKPAPKTAEKPVAKAAPRTAEKPVAKAQEKPAPKPVEKPVAKAAPKPLPRQDTADAIAVEQVERPQQPIKGPIGRTRSSVQIEEVLSDLFERTQDAFGLGRDEGLGYLLDLALEKIPAESGSVFVADFASNDLALADARGPKARELKRMNLRMPVGVGIVGFCAQEAVSLAISDTQKDARFYKNVSEKLGYDTRSILCAPMVSGGRTFGCLEVINKKGTSHFTDSELAILAYVAHQGATYLEQISA